MPDAEHRILHQEALGSLLRRRWVKVAERRMRQRPGVNVVRVLLTAVGRAAAEEVRVSNL